MNILKPLKRGNVLTEEEVLKDIEQISSERSTPNNKPKGAVMKGLGKDYGLVFCEEETLYASLDGESSTIVGKGKYNDFFFDGDDLYYTTGNDCFRWPNENIFSAEKPLWGICKHEGRIIVACPERKMILRDYGSPDYHAHRPVGIASYKGQLFCTSEEPDGLIRLPNELIASCGSYTDGICVLEDILYFAGQNGIIYQYDGNDVKEKFKLRNKFGSTEPIFKLDGVRDNTGDVIYASLGPGTRVINLTALTAKTILKNHSGAKSVTVVPLDYLKNMIK